LSWNGQQLGCPAGYGPAKRQGGGAGSQVQVFQQGMGWQERIQRLNALTGKAISP
jgi:hypothetical protein